MARVIQLKKQHEHLWIGPELAKPLGVDWDTMSSEGMVTFSDDTFPHAIFGIQVEGDEVLVIDRLKPDGTPDSAVRYEMDVSPDVFDLGAWVPGRPRLH